MKNILIILIYITSTSLLAACKKNDTISVNSNISNLKDINDFSVKINGDKYTKLGIACKENRLSNLKELLKNGANINLAKSDDIYEFDALYVAIENNNIEIVKYLIQNNIDLNKIYTEEGITPVSLAVMLDEKEILYILIKKGLNINAASISDSDYKYTPLTIAVDNNNYQIAKLLIENGANINIHDNYGNSIKNTILKKGMEWEKLINK